MNKRDIELAEQAGLVRALNQPFDSAQEKFAEFIRADERERIKAANAPEIERINAHLKSLEDAVKAEREACAQVCDVLAVHPQYASEITKLAATAIRSRRNT